MRYYASIQDPAVRPAYAKIGAVEGDVRNFIDGRRSILKIRNAVAAEAAFKNYPVPAIEDIENFIKMLEKFGYVKLVVQ